MIIHPDPNEHKGRESGVVLTKEGRTSAFGHVLTGLCTGIKRDFNFEETIAKAGLWDWVPQWVGAVASSVYAPLDNLHAATLAGDLGQTCVLTNCKIGPLGTWDDNNCPMVYNLTGDSSEATHAEILADIDGFILGILVPQIKPNKLSQYLYDFYLGRGLDPNGKFKASRNIELFKELVSFERLNIESGRFNSVYAKGKVWKTSSDEDIENTVREFYQLSFMQSCISFPETYKISYFIDLVKTLEQQTLQNGITDMLKHLGNKMREGFEWYIASELTQWRFNQETGIESGVLQDGQGITLAIYYVLASLEGQASGSPPSERITIMNIIAQYYRLHKHVIIGDPGQWSSECQKQHLVTKPDPGYVTHATFIGTVDGVVLASALTQYIKDNPNAKLSDLLSQYYNAGLHKQPEISSTKRFEHVDEIFKEIASKRGKRQTSSGSSSTSECYDGLQETLKKDCEVVTEENDLPLKLEDCDSVSKQVCNAITLAVQGALKGKFSILSVYVTNCHYDQDYNQISSLE